MTEVTIPLPDRKTSIGGFITHLLQAFLQTDYYAADHPKFQEARDGLFEAFTALAGDKGEINIFTPDSGEARAVFVEAPGLDAAPFKNIMPGDTARTYGPRFLDYLDQLELVSVSLPAKLGHIEFGGFINIMGELTLMDMKQEQAREHFLAKLKEYGLGNVSFIFMEDFISTERGISWRVGLALSRLRRDLLNLSALVTTAPEDLPVVTRELLHNIIRPFGDPEDIYALIMNLDLAETPALDPEETETGVLSALDEQTLIDIIPLFIDDATGEETLLKRTLPGEKFTRMLKKLTNGLISLNSKEADRRLQDLFDSGLLSTEAVSPAVRERLTIIRLVKSFLEHSHEYLMHMHAADDPGEYSRRSRPLARIVPVLLDGGQYPQVAALTELLVHHYHEKSERAQVARESLKTIVEGGAMERAVEAFLDSEKEDRVELGKFFKLLGSRSTPCLLEVISRSDNVWTIKNAGDLLLEMGPKQAELLISHLDSGLSNQARVTVIRILAGLEPDELKELAGGILEKHTADADPDVRKEAVHTLGLLSAASRFELFRKASTDPVLEVKLEGIRGLGVAGDPAAFDLLREIVEAATGGSDQEKWEMASAAILALGYLYQGCEEIRGEIGDYVVEFTARGYSKGKIKRLLKTDAAFPEKAMASLIYTLGRVGTGEAAGKLEEISGSRDETLSKKAAAELSRLRE